MIVFDIATLEAQREGIEERLHKLRMDLQLTQNAVDRTLADYHQLQGRIALLREQAIMGAARESKKRTAPPPQLERVPNPKRSAVADAALAIIAEEGHPIGRSELYAKVNKKGFRLEGKNPMMVFSTMLWRERQRIVRLRGHGYWPADKPFAPANYDPGTAQPSLL